MAKKKFPKEFTDKVKKEIHDNSELKRAINITGDCRIVGRAIYFEYQNWISTPKEIIEALNGKNAEEVKQKAEKAICCQKLFDELCDICGELKGKLSWEPLWIK